MKRRAVSVSSGEQGQIPAYLYGSVEGLVAAFIDPSEPVPENNFREPTSYYGTRAQQDGRWRALRAWRRAGQAQEQWAVEHGWTSRQLAGMRHPEWIGYGWADPPPHPSPRQATAKD